MELDRGITARVVLRYQVVPRRLMGRIRCFSEVAVIQERRDGSWEDAAYVQDWREYARSRRLDLRTTESALAALVLKSLEAVRREVFRVDWQR
jgi:hypothetical protein